MCSGILGHVCGLVNLSLWLILWFGSGFIFESWKLIFNFSVTIFPISTLVLELFSGTYLYKLLFLWCPLIENSSM